jgi:hypothetical protein
MVSWVLQRRPEEEGEALSRDLAESQHSLTLREEVRTVSQVTKQTWAQKNMAEAELLAQKRADERAEARGAVRSLRKALIATLSHAFGQLPESVQMLIQACEDADRLEAAIAKVQDLNSLDEFNL